MGYVGSVIDDSPGTWLWRNNDGAGYGRFPETTSSRVGVFAGNARAAVATWETARCFPGGNAKSQTTACLTQLPHDGWLSSHCTQTGG